MGSRTPSTPKPGTQTIRASKTPPRDLHVRVEIGAGKARVVRTGRATLTDETFRFRTGRTGDQGADFFVHLRYDEIASVVLDPSAVSLTITAADDKVYKVHVGKHAAAWKEYMRPPAGRLATLGITAKTRLLLLPLPDEELTDEIEAGVPGAAAVDDSVADLEMIVFGAEHKADLARLKGLAARLKRPGGILWIVFSASSRTIGEDDIDRSGAALGLLRTGTIALSRTYRAFRLRVAGPG
jgi:hypothetical protein